MHLSHNFTMRSSRPIIRPKVGLVPGAAKASAVLATARVYVHVKKANSVKAKAKAKASHSKLMVKASHFKDRIKVVYLSTMT